MLRACLTPSKRTRGASKIKTALKPNSYQEKEYDFTMCYHQHVTTNVKAIWRSIPSTIQIQVKIFVFLHHFTVWNLDEGYTCLQINKIHSSGTLIPFSSITFFNICSICQSVHDLLWCLRCFCWCLFIL